MEVNNMRHGIFGWDLPPGVRVSDIPGNRPEDEEWEKILEGFWDSKHCSDELYKKFEKATLDSDLVNVVDKAIEYGIEVGNKQVDTYNQENKYYESEYRQRVRNPKLIAYFKSQRQSLIDTCFMLRQIIGEKCRRPIENGNPPFEWAISEKTMQKTIEVLNKLGVL
jgi:hypothetical protein